MARRQDRSTPRLSRTRRGARRVAQPLSDRNSARGRTASASHRSGELARSQQRALEGEILDSATPRAPTLPICLEVLPATSSESQQTSQVRRWELWFVCLPRTDSEPPAQVFTRCGQRSIAQATESTSKFKNFVAPKLSKPLGHLFRRLGPAPVASSDSDCRRASRTNRAWRQSRRNDGRQG